MLVEFAVEGEGGVDRGRVGRNREMAEIRVAIFGPQRPVVVDRVFEAGAEGPADASRGFGSARREVGHAIEVGAENLSVGLE